MMKSMKLTLYFILTVSLLAGAVALRIVLAANNWPLLNSDEAVIGLMAIHIQQGERPIFFDGQNYLGALEAYIGAVLLQLLGVSVFSLRLGLILLFALFLISMYFLTRLLYNKHYAIFIIFILALGSNAMLSRQLNAIGGYMETITFSSLAFLLTTWLALTPPGKTARTKLLRLTGYCGWGIAVGLGLWSHLLIIPFVIGSFIGLVVCCGREFFKGAFIFLILGIVVGAWPLIAYNLGAAPGETSLDILLFQQGHTATSLELLLRHLLGTLQLSLPIATGSPFCHFSEIPRLHFLGFEAPQIQTNQCKLIQTSWSLVYLALFVLAAGLAIIHLWKTHYPFRRIHLSNPCKQNILRLLLLFSAALTLFIYIRSESSVKVPGMMMRYLVGLWVATPVVLWVLWIGAGKSLFSFPEQWVLQARALVSKTLLIFVVVIFLFGTAKTLSEIPEAQAAEDQQQKVVQTLLDQDVTHLYSEYWTCNWITFKSKERIPCIVIRAIKDTPCSLQPDIFNRYQPYVDAVQQDRRAAYMLFKNYRCDTSIEQKLKQEEKRYRRFEIDYYVVYQPL